MSNMLPWNRFLLLVLLSILQSSQCVIEVQYSYKIISGTKGDGFGISLATSYRHLMVGAPWTKNYKGYVLVEPDRKIYAPEGEFFGLRGLDVNQQFLVASARTTSISWVYVFSSNPPYTLKARIPVPSVGDVKLTKDNTIIVVTDSSRTKENYVLIYKYDGNNAWNKEQSIKIDAETGGPVISTSLAVSNNCMTVGYMESDPHGRVDVYSLVKGHYKLTATLRQDLRHAFGQSIAIEGNHLAATSIKEQSVSVHTYHFDSSTQSWKENGQIDLPDPNHPHTIPHSSVSIREEYLAVTVSDPAQHPEVCAYVYKVPSNNNITNINNNITSNNYDVSSTEMAFKWNKVMILKTNGIPMKHTQIHYQISVRDGMVFTTTMDYDGYGMLFVHTLRDQSHH